MPTVISVENLSKHYRLGLIGGATFREEFGRWWARRLGRPDPWAKVGQTDHGNRDDGHIWALRDVNFTVEEGEILGIIGRNGAGKSTLLKILSKITAPTSGRARIRGRVGSLLEVGTGFHGELTGRENVFLNGTILGMSRREVNAKVDEIVDFAGVGEFIDTPVKRYSSGMTVRLAFAVAAHLDPEILIVDEVLAVGDAAFQRKCIGKLRSVTGEGRTVLFVSHNMAAIESLCSRCLVMEAGRLSFDGTPYEAVSRYINQQLARTPDDLSTRKRTQGTQIIRFSGIRLFNGRGEPVPALKTGEPGVIRIAFEQKGGEELRDVIFGVPVSNEFGERITQFATSYVGQDFAEISPDVSCVEVVIDKLSIIPGRYFITLFCSIKGVVSDWVMDAAALDIEQGDYFGSGKLPPNGNGYLLADHAFRLASEKVCNLSPNAADSAR